MTRITPVPPDDPLMEAVQGVLDCVANPGSASHVSALEDLRLAADRARDAAANTKPITEKDIIRAISPAWLGWDMKDAHRREGFNRRAARYVADLIGGPGRDRGEGEEGDADPVATDLIEETHEAGQLKRVSRRVLNAVVDYVNATGNPVAKVEASLEGEPGDRWLTFSFYPKGDGGGHARPGDLVRIGNCLAAQEVLRAGQGWVAVAPDASLWIGPDRYQVVCRREDIEKG